MKYFGSVIKVLLMVIGLVLIFRSWEFMAFSSECLTGLAIFLTGLYFALDGKFGSDFSGCLFVKKEEKKKGFFG